MKHLLTLSLTFFGLWADAQNKVQLRDVEFTVPAAFAHIVKENKVMDYDLFYENGRVHKDSLLPNPFSIIMYQYFENPGGTEHPELVLKRLVDIMAEDFAMDTLIMNATNYYCIAKFDVLGKEVYELKSLGENGYVNIQFVNEGVPVTENIETVQAIAKSIKHSGEYGGEYTKHMKEGANSSKIAIIGIALSIIATIAGKYIKKVQQKGKQDEESTT